ncbi:MAG: asparagine synthase C-terminal domain-containing protein [Ignisphaera sp.]|nr:asparagine synthase C-terminal domain-containing protein [Ignisphaera sp.]
MSGGIDTTTVALAARSAGLTLNGFLAIYRGGLAKDVPYAEYVARTLGIDLTYVFIDAEEAHEVAQRIVECIGRDKLNSHGDGGCIEIRNDIAFYRIMVEARNRACNCVFTGSGGDELFSGYSFMVVQSGEKIRDMIERFATRGRYPELEIAECVGVKAVSPYLDRDAVALALEIPVECLRTSLMMGKEVLREILATHSLQLVALREKTPTESGAGTKTFCRSVYDE